MGNEIERDTGRSRAYNVAKQGQRKILRNKEGAQYKTELSRKTDKIVRALCRIMPNLGGPTAGKKLLTAVVHSLAKDLKKTQLKT